VIEVSGLGSGFVRVLENRLFCFVRMRENETCGRVFDL
jgi:hypothetical protein